MSVVWLAEHDDSRQCVALKTQEDVDAGHLARLRREIATLSNLTHPGIIRVVEHGAAAGVPWYAMDLLSGRPLRAHLDTASPTRNTVVPRASSSTESLPPPRLLPPPTMDADALEDAGVLLAPWASHAQLEDRLRTRLLWAADLCHTLAYLHGEGVVHCDIKPENIFVCEQGRQLVLTDFGLASRFGTRVEFETLQSAGLVAAGTVDYIAPERIKGLPFDARADLYSLGCLLYELMTGRVPFQDGLGARTLVHHLSTPPRPPSAVGVVLPAALERVILQLLAKEPSHRPGHVQVVLHVLEGLGIHRPPARDAPAPRPYLFKPTLTGRVELLTQLRAHLDDAMARANGSVLLLGGESGVGKTTVATELVKLGRTRQLETFTGQCAHLDARGTPTRQAPLSAFLDILRHVVDHCRAGGQVLSDIVVGERGPVLAPLAPFVTSLPGQELLPSPAPLAADLAQRRLFDAVIAILDAHAMGRPLLLVLDDLQWADELSTALMHHLVRAVAERSWVVVGLYRSDEVSAEFRTLLGEPGVVTADLGRLNPEEIGVMMAEMLGMENPPPVLFEFASAQSEGNPFFVAEYLQLAVARGILERSPTGDWRVTGGASTAEALEAAGLPSSVRALVDGRMARIDPAVWRWGEAAAVVGREVDPELLPQVLAAVPEVGVGFAIAELQRQGILNQTEDGRVRFSHDKFRQAAYDRLGTAERQALHRSAARVLAEHDAWREDLGWHWQQAGDADEAVDAWLDGARAAAEAYAYGLAQGRLSSALDLMSSDDPRARRAWLLLVDSVLLVQGDHERALDVLRGLIQVAPDDGDLGCRLGSVLLRTGHIDEADAALDAARTAYRKVGDQRGEAQTLHHLAQCRQEKGLWNEALSYYVHTLELSRWLEDADAQASTMLRMAALHRVRAENEKALDLLEDALDIHRARGNTRGEAQVLLDRARVYQAMGRFTDARPLSRSALRILRRVGDRPAEADALTEIARQQRNLGNLDKAEVLFHEALRIHDAVGARIAAAEVTCELASVQRDRGAHEQAERLYDDARVRAGETGGAPILAHIQQEYAELLRRRGDLARARTLLEEALAAHTASGDVGRQTTGLMLMARLFASAGQLGPADAAYVGAIERARASRHRACEVEALLGRAEIACLSSDAQRALETLEGAHVIVRHDQLDQLAPALYGLRGLALGIAGQEEAARCCEIAIRRASQIGDRYAEARALFWWATRSPRDLGADERRTMLERSASLLESRGYLLEAKNVKMALIAL